MEVDEDQGGEDVGTLGIRGCDERADWRRRRDQINEFVSDEGGWGGMGGLGEGLREEARMLWRWDRGRGEIVRDGGNTLEGNDWELWRGTMKIRRDTTQDKDDCRKKGGGVAVPARRGRLVCV